MYHPCNSSDWNFTLFNNNYIYFRTNPVANHNEISQEISNNTKEMIEQSDINYTDEKENVDTNFDNTFNDISVEDKVNIVYLYK